MEWINPQYTDLMAALRRRQETGPRAGCGWCQGTGKRRLPDSHGGAEVVCRRCGGQRSVAAVRMFVTR